MSMTRGNIILRAVRRLRSIGTRVRRVFVKNISIISKSDQHSPSSKLTTAHDEATRRWLDSANDISADVSLSNSRPVNTDGHFCDLYIGAHKIFGKVALKRPRIIGVVGDGYKDKDIARFLREAQTWKQLSHPFILRFVGPCEIDGAVYLVSPFMENGTLIQFLSRNPTLPRLRFVRELASALAYMHDSNIVHGDIKGNNILISNDHHVQVTDFGLAKLHSSMRTSTTLQGAGATRWQVPELANNARKSFESDVYAFSMTVVEILTGSIPFPQYRETIAIMRAVFDRGERPLKAPQRSPQGESYTHVWDVLELCWLVEPKDRLKMEAVVRVLHPQTGIQALESTRCTSISTSTSSRVPTMLSALFRGDILVDLSEPGLTEFEVIMRLNQGMFTAAFMKADSLRIQLGGLVDMQTEERLHERALQNFLAGYRERRTTTIREVGNPSIVVVSLVGRLRRGGMRAASPEFTWP